MKKLDKRRDNFRDAKLTIFEEVTFFFYCLFETKQHVTFQVLPVIKKAAKAKPSNGPNSNTTSKAGIKRAKAAENGLTGGPKKPINPYLIFCQENRASIQERHVAVSGGIEMNNHEITKALAQNWHDLSAEQKQFYYNLYEQEKEKYEQQLKVYNQRNQEALLIQHQQLLKSATEINRD